MLTTLLPWAALALALIALFLRDSAPSDEASHDSGAGPWLIAGFVALLLAAGAGFLWQDSLKDLLPTSLGFAAGGFVAVLVLVASSLKGQPREGHAFPIAIGAFGCAIWTLFDPAVRETYRLGAAAGVGIVGWIVAGAPRGNWASRASIVMALGLAGDVLGHRSAAIHASEAGSLFAFLTALGALLAFGIPAKHRPIGIGAAVAVFVGGAWLLSSRHFFVNDLWILFAGAAGIGLLTAWLAPDDESGSFGFVLSVMIWLAVATLAFGMRKGYGMSIATLGGAAMILCFGRRRALLAIAPLAMLVVYRVFRELHTDASRALDIGQHYALIGIAAGAGLLVLAGEWRVSKRAAVWGSLLWAPIFLAVPFVSGVVLAAKGFVGVLAGLGFGPFVDGLKGSRNLDVLSLQLGVGMAMAGGYGWMSGKLDLSREEKVQSLMWVSAIVVLLAAGIALLSRRRADESPGSVS